jgi:hypothetical protein
MGGKRGYGRAIKAYKFSFAKFSWGGPKQLYSIAKSIILANNNQKRKLL